jgi:xylulokinase
MTLQPGRLFLGGHEVPDRYVLGVDLGTTGSKAILLSAGGRLAATATTDYPLLTPHPLWAEQDADEWWSATAKSIREVLERAGVAPASVAAVGLTGQMHGLVLLDERRRVLRPAILWNDQRTEAECAAIHERVGEDRVLALTGNLVLPGFTAPKVLWVQRHEPDVWARARTILLPKDFVRARLTDVLASDVSDASGTSLFDVEHRGWSDEMREALGIAPTALPQVAESPAVVGAVTAEAARATGLAQGTPVVAGAGDQAAQAVGSGILDEGMVSITLGTSGVVFAASQRYRIHPRGRLHAFCHAAPSLWHLMGVMLSAGGSLRWYRDALGGPEKAQAAAAGRDAYDVLLEDAAQVPAGSDGLLFLPYLTGERTPHADPCARGVFCGLTVRHRKAHLTRAVLEGVAFGLRDSLELMKDLGIPIERIRVSGGGARSALWRQILADVCGTPIASLAESEGAALGAALLAGVGAGLFAGVREASAVTVRETAEIVPGPDTGRYQRLYGVYRDLYPHLAPDFRRIHDVVSS